MLDPALILPKAVVFDLDGTLVDTAPDLCGALNHVLDSEGRRHVSPDELRHMVGHGARALLVRGMAETGNPATHEDLDRLLPLFLEYYGAHVADRSQPFEGVENLLKELEDRNVRIGICTNKPESLAINLLDALGLSRYFGAVVGGDSLPVRKPDPATFKETLARLGAADGPALMVGDSRTDVETARAAGVPVICVSFGYTDVAVETLYPDIVIDHYRDFGEAVGALNFR